ncbi:MAG: type VII secretion target [Microbacterium sp.]
MDSRDRGGLIDGFEVDYDQLAADAPDLFAASDALSDAVSAGLAAQEMSENAFGLLCVAMVPPSQMVQRIAVTALKAESAAFEAAAMNLRNTAIDYETADATSAKCHRELLGRAR